MRFQFCGGLDCPDWVLAGINLLSRMSSLKMRTMCTAVIQNLLGGDLDMAKIQKATVDSKLDAAELRAAVSVLRFVLESAARHAAPAPLLGQELQQLGLPREHAASLARLLDQQRRPLVQQQRRLTLREPGLASVDWELAVVQHSASPAAGSARVVLSLQPETAADGWQPPTPPPPPPLQLLLSPHMAAVCRRELLIARQRMEDVS